MQEHLRRLASIGPIGLCLALIAGWAGFSPPAHAKEAGSKQSESAPQDAIDVAGHIALPAGSVTGLRPTRHFGSYYVYAEYATGNRIIFIDVTKPNQPSVAADLAYPANGSPERIIAVAGESALAIGVPPSSPSSAPLTTPQSVKILSFAAFEHPRVVRQFSGVTAVGEDDARGLIFLAKSEGVWILKKHLAEDPAVEAAYANYVSYSH